MSEGRYIATVFLCLLLATSACTSIQDEGFSAYGRGDYATALKFYRPLAEKGGPYDHSQYMLGWMYANGHGVPQDYAEAAKWYKKVYAAVTN